MRFAINLLALAIVAGPAFGSDVDVAKHKAQALLNLAALSRDRTKEKADPCPCPDGGPCSCATCAGGGCNCGKGCTCVIAYKDACAKARKEGLALVVWTNQPVAAQFPGAVCCRRTKAGEKAGVKIFHNREGKLRLRRALTGAASIDAIGRALYAPEPAPVTQIPLRLPAGPMRAGGGC